MWVFREEEVNTPHCGATNKRMGIFALSFLAQGLLYSTNRFSSSVRKFLAIPIIFQNFLGSKLHSLCLINPSAYTTC